MIVVVGSLTARPETLAEVTDLALTHVRRSRTEPGCLHHEVAADVEDPHRLVFSERWADLGALRAHFAVPEVREFARRTKDLRPTLEIYEATPAQV